MFYDVTVGMVAGKTAEILLHWGSITPNYPEFEGFDKTSILMQYTGLKDKNGKEIYEGDILRWNYEEDKFAEELLEVRWGIGEFVLFSKLFKRFGLPDGSETGMINARAYMIRSEVIGNIYENPELLEAKVK